MIRPLSHAARHALVLLACAAPVSAAEWTWQPAPGGTEPLNVERVAASGNDYVLFGERWWVHGTADGRRTVRPIGDTLTGLIPSGGGVLTGTACALAQWDNDGVTRWYDATDFACTPMPDGYSPARDAQGSLWIPTAEGGFRQFADGRRSPLPATTGDRAWRQLTPVPTDVAAYGMARSGALSLLRPAAVDWTVPQPANVEHVEIATTADGDLLVAGMKHEEGRSYVYAARYSGTGTLRWERTHRDMPTNRLGLHVLAGDRFAIGTTLTTPPIPTISDSAVHGFGGDGALQWTHRLSTNTFEAFMHDADPDPRRAPSVFGVFAKPRATNPDTPPALQLTRLSSAGIASETTSPVTLDTVAIQQDGTLIHARADGTVLRSGPGVRETLSSIMPAETMLLDTAVAADGASFALLATGDRMRMIEVDAAGRLRWTVALETQANVEGTPKTSIVSSGAVVCVGPLGYADRFGSEAVTDLHCIDRSRGVTAYTTPPAFASGGLPQRRMQPALRMRGDGSVVSVDVEVCMRCAPRVYRSTIDQRGIRSSTLLGTIPQLPAAVAIDANGRVALLVEQTTRTVLALSGANDMLQAHSTPLTALSGVPLFELLADGAVLVHARQATGGAVFRFDADGTLRWFRASRYADIPTPVSTRSYAAVGDAGVLFAERRTHGGTHHVSLLDPATGAVRWSRVDERNHDDGVSAAAIDATRGEALIVTRRAGAAMLVRHALSDGTVLGAVAIDCPDALSCEPEALYPMPDGVRLFAHRIDGAHGSQLQISASSVAHAPVAAGQAGLNGTWYAPDTSGQGLVLEYAPDAGTVLGGWFTYAYDGRNRTDDLRWYSLQGSVPNGATVAEIQLYSGSNGAFATPRATNVSPAGYARLTLTSCNEAVFEYHVARRNLDEPSVSGEIPLRRLSTAQFACTDASGLALPDAASSTAAGFQRGQWGTWFDPSTPGQGLLFDLRPPSANDPGALSGGWFTYDVAGSNDGPNGQRWFLLQGDLASARDGTATVPMYRALGGTFDRGINRNVVRVGDVTLRFSACDRATLDYHFDDVPVAGTFAGRSGRVSLSKLTGCAER